MLSSNPTTLRSPGTVRTEPAGGATPPARAPRRSVSRDASVGARQAGARTPKLLVLEPEAMLTKRAEPEPVVGPSARQRRRRDPGRVEEPPEQAAGHGVDHEHP